ncbi:hypothetical protein CkaCkLH20_00918 [Colletotrichum karsti]|uniref:DUF7908 domain-containing protein n=1 Tax=Colletotrichum karsti TaxID=1095194 RepID=A0A9P6IE83_9PEZI|nr:uncharacterized protein CkaCkLH20_00918 [Colletotrichum karsti]KAF9881772.1 hypothetical protein CkaCkLH20_00918 [Colletotrichum karsti]
MVWTKKAAAFAVASLPIIAQAAIIRDISGLIERADLGNGAAPLPSIPAGHNRKRQVTGGFLDTDPGTTTTANCGDAASFSLNNFGQLEVNGQVLSTNPGTPFIALRPITPQGSITVTFSLNNGALTWSNDAFFGGQAGFCQDPTGQVYATFADPAIAYPANCAAIRLGPVLASTCQGGSVIPSGLLPPTGTSAASAGITSGQASGQVSGRVTALPTTIVSTGSDGSVFSTVSSFETTLTGPITGVPTDTPAVPTSSAVINGTLSLPPGMYPGGSAFSSPAGETCRVVTESWMFGETTLLPRTTTVV